jgi:hypothetical protein
MSFCVIKNPQKLGGLGPHWAVTPEGIKIDMYFERDAQHKHAGIVTTGLRPF